MWPTDENLLAAWRRLVADPDSAGEFASLVLAPLEADVARFVRGDHPNEVTSAVDDAVLAFLRRPAAYDPDRLPLPAYLRLIARRRLQNLRSAESRHHAGRIPWDAVELGLTERNDPEEALSLADMPQLNAVIDALPEPDRRVLDLMLEGARDTSVFAVALGISDQPAEVQFDAVKRMKDRIKARLKRAGGEP